MTALRERMIEDLQLHGLSNNTQLSYVRSVRFLAEYYRKPPDQITEEELREYFLCNRSGGAWYDVPVWIKWGDLSTSVRNN